MLPGHPHVQQGPIGLCPGDMFALAKRGIFMIQKNNYKEIRGFLYTVATQEQIFGNMGPVVSPVKKLETPAKAQIFSMASLPNIGHEKVKNS